MNKVRKGQKPYRLNENSMYYTYFFRKYERRKKG